MFDITRQKIGFTCENCDFENYVTLAQARSNTVIICRGCKTNIQLIDQLSSVRKSIKSVNRSITSLMEEFDKIGDICIKF